MKNMIDCKITEFGNLFHGWEQRTIAAVQTKPPIRQMVKNNGQGADNAQVFYPGDL